MLGSQIDLYFWNRMPDYFASARGAYKSPACRNLCIYTLLLLWPDTGQHRSSAKILISRRRQKKTKLSFVILRASFCEYRESGDSFKIFSFLIFCPNKAFSELFSKIQLKDPKALEFFQNRGKFENPILASRRH